MNETEIHKAVIQNLSARAAPNVFWFHVPNDAKRSFATANRMRSMGMVAGVPDLVLIKNGEVFGLELKAKGGRVQPSQRLTHAAMQEAGAKTAIATGLDEALVTLECWGILKRGVNAA